jgi:hypothetical protein
MQSSGFALLRAGTNLVPDASSDVSITSTDVDT